MDQQTKQKQGKKSKMKTITLKFTDEQASNIGYFLRKKYNADKRTNLSKLCKVAVFHEIRKQANKDIEEFNDEDAYR
jgi:hypothetical protein